MPGGRGSSWFLVEITPEYVYTAGEGGQGNSWFAVDVVSEPVEDVQPPEPTPQPEFGGGQEPFTHIGAPIGAREEIDIPAEISVGRRVEIEVAADVGVVVALTAEFRAELVTGRTVELSVPGVRHAGIRLANLSREDEEFLMLMC